MGIRKAGGFSSVAGLVMVILLQPARAEREKPPSGPEDALTWAEVSKEQEAAARKLAVPVAFTNSIGMRFVLIPSGKFMMGSADSAKEARAKCVGITAAPEWAEDEHPRHKVRLTSAFYMSIHEVTGAQLKTVAATGKKKKKRRSDGKGSPAHNVPWDEAVKFSEEISKREGRTYRLPTEAEWEYACRAGTTTPFCFGETISTNHANYNWSVAYGSGQKVETKTKRGPVPVGSSPPNAWGLYDMHGNVWEWCWDWYGKYGEGAATDPKGPSNGTQRVVRGGCWLNSPGVCRSAKRNSHSPTGPPDNTGFRVIVEVKPLGPDTKGI